MLSSNYSQWGGMLWISGCSQTHIALTNTNTEESEVLKKFFEILSDHVMKKIVIYTFLQEETLDCLVIFWFFSSVTVTLIFSEHILITKIKYFCIVFFFFNFTKGIRKMWDVQLLPRLYLHTPWHTMGKQTTCLASVVSHLQTQGPDSLLIQGWKCTLLSVTPFLKMDEPILAPNFPNNLLLNSDQSLNISIRKVRLGKKKKKKNHKQSKWHKNTCMGVWAATQAAFYPAHHSSHTIQWK